MLQYTERELRAKERDVWTYVIAGTPIAVARDGMHRVALTRTFVMTAKTIPWEDYLADHGGTLYESVADGESVALTRSDRTIYMVPVAVLAPTGATPEQIERWLEDVEDDWLVGPTFVASFVDPDDADIIRLRL